jgi:hypothetical protein
MEMRILVGMERAHTYHGMMVDVDTPNWTVLEDLVGLHLVGCFMWMFEVELEDGTRVHAYKHSDTRAYLHLGEDGRAFAYVAKGRYRELDLVAALGHAFDQWDRLGATSVDRKAVAEAIRKAEAQSDFI